MDEVKSVQASTVDSTSQAVRAGLWYTICNFLVKGLTFLTTPIFSRVLGTADYGNYNNFTSWLSILTVIVTLDMYATIPRARFDYSEDLDQYISSICVLGTGITGCAYLIVALFMPFFSNLFSMSPFYIHILFINLLVAPTFQILQTRNRVFYKYKLFVVLTFVLTASTIGLALVLVNTTPDKLMGRVLGQIIPTFILNLIIYFYLVGKGRSIKREHCRYALKVCIPYVPHLLAINLLGTSDRVMIRHYCGSSDVGLYSLAYTCSLCINVLCTSLNQAWSPWLTEQLHHNNIERIRSVAKKYMALFCVLAVFISLFGPELIFIFGGREYMDAVRVMPPVFVGLLFQYAYTMNVNIEMFDRKTIGTAIGTGTAATLNIVLNILLIPIFGYVAAAYTTLIGYIALFLIHVYLVHRIGRGNVYDNKYTFGLLILCSIAMLAISLLYSHTIIRYLVIAIYAIVIIIVAIRNKDWIMGLLRNRNRNREED